MFIKRSIIFLLLILLLSPCVLAASMPEFVVAVHKSRDVDALTTSELKRIFLGKVKKWSDGSPVILVFNPQTDIHTAFTRQILHKSSAQLNTYWRKRLYSGQGMMPYMAKTAEEIVAYLDTHKNAISYLPKTDLTDSLKVIKVVK